MTMSRAARSITKQLNNKTCMLLLFPSSSPSSSSSSSVKLFTSTAQSPIKKVPSYFLLPCCTSCLRRTLTSEQSFFSSSSSSQRTSSLSLHKRPLFSSSQHNSIHGGFFTVRRLSSFNIPSPAPTVETNHRYSSYNSEVDHLRASIPVRAYFFSTSIDLKSLVNQNQVNFVPPTSPLTNHVVLRFGDTNSHPHPRQDLEVSLSGSNYSYMVVFQYGSIVMFNIVDRQVNQYLKIIERHASGLLSELTKDGEVFVQNQIKYEVRENPNLPTWMQGGLDYIMLQHLNINGIRTIGSVLGQSVALSYYACQVDRVVAEFTDSNRGVEKFITFIRRKKKLYQLVGKANSNLADVRKLGLFERSEIAWTDAKYVQMWKYLRDIFKLSNRFAGLHSNITLMEQNISFLSKERENRRRSFSSHAFNAALFVALLHTVFYPQGT